jgi:hypothetical protein
MTLAKESQSTFEDQLQASKSKMNTIRSISELQNKAIPTVEPEALGDARAKIPEVIPLYVAVDHINPDRMQWLKEMDKQKLIETCLMYAECVDSAFKKNFLTSEPIENPVQRALEFACVGRAQIEAVGHCHHKKKVLVKSAGVNDLLGFCEVEIMDFKGVANGNSFYLASPFLRPLSSQTYDEERIAENRDLRKANSTLQEEKEILRRRLAEKESSVQQPVNYEPKKAAKIVRRQGPAGHQMSSADGNFLWEDCPKEVKERPFKCPTCASRFTNKHGLNQHKYQQHKGENQTANMKLCKDCQFSFAVNNFSHHKCKKTSTQAKC